MGAMLRGATCPRPVGSLRRLTRRAGGRVVCPAGLIPGGLRGSAGGQSISPYSSSLKLAADMEADVFMDIDPGRGRQMVPAGRGFSVRRITPPRAGWPDPLQGQPAVREGTVCYFLLISNRVVVPLTSLVTTSSGVPVGLSSGLMNTRASAPRSPAVGRLGGIVPAPGRTEKFRLFT
jgi:hypothetical protein